MRRTYLSDAGEANKAFQDSLDRNELRIVASYALIGAILLLGGGVCRRLVAGHFAMVLAGRPDSRDPVRLLQPRHQSTATLIALASFAVLALVDELCVRRSDLTSEVSV